ncbi:MAG: SIS domain-containing protein [Chloroflexota bacterium]
MVTKSSPAAAGLTERELSDQPRAWARTIACVAEQVEQLRPLLAGQAVFTGCGSSYFLAIAAARVHQQVTGRPATAIPASELFLAADSALPSGQRGPLVAFSRSGDTTETLRAAAYYRDRGLGPVIGVTANAESPLARDTSAAIVLPWADDRSIVMTRGFTSMLLASWLASAHLAGDQAFLTELGRLPGEAVTVLDQARPLASGLGRNLGLGRFIYLGLAEQYGLAREAMLKMKEMTQVASEAYSPLEFRHGPISVVDDSTLVVLFSTERGADYYRALLSDVRRCGGQTLAVGLPVAPDVANFTLPLGGELSDRGRGLLAMLFMQLLALERALALGRNPEQPQNLTRVVELTQ